jgi:hypothetical protein
MNKPEYFKNIGYDSPDKYIDFIHTHKLNFVEVNKYDRHEFFNGVKTFFLIERFVNQNPFLYDQFLDISKEFYSILNTEYGDGLIYNLQFSLLPNGSSILPHYDEGLGFTFSHRIHIPLITNENIVFSIDGCEHNFQKGKIIEINNKKKHSVKNLNIKTFYRVHIILDYLPLIYEKFIENDI